jgi:acetylornithine deacetylase/succinyl-diaminopimelate desuccinylase-like protein
MERREFVAAVLAAPFARASTDRSKIYAHIDANLPRHIERIQEYIRQPSVSAENRGIKECAELTRRYLAEAGCTETALIPTPGHPAVWGWLDAGSRKTLAVYWMYDVQPVNESEWTTPPFEARLVPANGWGPDAKMIRGRGAANQKGPERAFLNALESIRAVNGKLPVNLMFVCEGEEELGSPNLPLVVSRYRQRLARADGVLFPFLNLGRDGRASFSLGNKGIVYMELEARGGPQGGPKNAEIHSSQKAQVDSPVWRLVQALASMTDPSGNVIRIEQFRSAIRKPTAREIELFERYLPGYDADAVMRAAGIDRFADSADKREALRRLWFEPSLNIDGVWAGYTGPGTKTILPHKAAAKIDFRLVPDQSAAEIAKLVRKHLDGHGFTDVRVNWWNGYDPSQSDPDSPPVRAALDVCRARGVPVQVALRLAGSAPHYLFTRDLKLPLLSFGLGSGGGAHSRDEFLVVEASEPARDLAFCEKSFVDLLYRFAEI